MTDDFSNEPVSITHIKSERTNKAADWTPRDALVDLLRSIDKDEITLDAVFIIFTEPDKYSPGVRISSPNNQHTTAMLANAAFDHHLRCRDMME